MDARRLRERRADHGILGERPVGHRIVDPGEVLAHDRAGAEVEVTDLGVAHLALGQPDGPAAGGQLRVRVGRPQRVEHRGAGEVHGVPGPRGGQAPAVEHDEAGRGDGQRHRPGRPSAREQDLRGPRNGGLAHPASAASTIAANASGSRLAPPTSAPSHVGQRQQLGGVVGLHASAVEDAGAPRLVTRAVGHEGADEPAGILGLFGRGDLPGPDRPDRLVGDDHVAEAVLRHIVQTFLHLVAQLALGVAAIALLLGLADAEDRQQAGLQRRGNLGLERPVGLPEQLAALGMPEDDAVHVELGQHRRGHLAGEGAAVG